MPLNINNASAKIPQTTRERERGGVSMVAPLGQLLQIWFRVIRDNIKVVVVAAGDMMVIGIYSHPTIAIGTFETAMEDIRWWVPGRMCIIWDHREWDTMSNNRERFLKESAARSNITICALPEPTFQSRTGQSIIDLVLTPAWKAENLRTKPGTWADLNKWTDRELN